MRLLVFGASNSRQSINQKLAIYAGMKSGLAVKVLDLNEWQMPIYGIDHEKEYGIPKLAHDFVNEVEGSLGIIISIAEHNGLYTTVFKNIIDWVSRTEGKVWRNKAMFLLSTSPGKRGGKSALNAAIEGFPFMGAQIISSFSLPSFRENFDSDRGITHPDLSKEFDEALEQFLESVSNSTENKRDKLVQYQ